jgi:hypothetical protein
MNLESNDECVAWCKKNNAVITFYNSGRVYIYLAHKDISHLGNSFIECINECNRKLNRLVLR